jgi:hypothetical protein
LFSAVVTTIVVDTYKNLQPNKTELLLFQLVAIRLGNSTSSDPFSSFVIAANDQWINGLWFTSLAFSLTTALIAVLTKQWLHHFMSSTSGTPQERARLVHFRFEAIQRWGVPAIIGTLPILLHIALLMFFIGLVLFLFPIDKAIGSAVSAVALFFYISYLITAILPIPFPACPYKTPMSTATSFI